MIQRTPLANLIQTQMQKLGLSDEALGCSLGYTNPTKAAGRVHALCNGLPLSAKSHFALRRLPAALDIDPDIVVHAVSDTERLIALRKQAAEEQCRLEQEAEDAAWRASFQPQAVILTEHTIPTQITMCGLTGGAKCRRIIPLDLTQSPVTFIQQALDALPQQTVAGSDGGRGVLFFGEAFGLIINYAPDAALRCSLKGEPLEVLDKAYRLGEVRLSFGGGALEPSAVSRVLGLR
ncbi:hypothetical protein MMSR116_06420 [Methylobacterium mesophilicum SR1.6/6]|uniref:Uncharacterized protein n=1 Tax=Methylobacterium mesophilicum SR1.6/6 TaxID=908290 RepID=A0A6B9FHY4_9HYPH|nr:hypothetical protein [Methylobacterium mesophilicum]QGY01579.1 hypothetical protein MMSR116_06420 [Methylobacterium mesophilicum SR1.6/6]